MKNSVGKELLIYHCRMILDCYCFTVLRSLTRFKSFGSGLDNSSFGRERVSCHHLTLSTSESETRIVGSRIVYVPAAKDSDTLFSTLRYSLPARFLKRSESVVRKYQITVTDVPFPTTAI